MQHYSDQSFKDFHDAMMFSSNTKFSWNWKKILYLPLACEYVLSKFSLYKWDDQSNGFWSRTTYNDIIHLNDRHFNEIISDFNIVITYNNRYIGNGIFYNSTIVTFIVNNCNNV